MEKRNRVIKFVGLFICLTFMTACRGNQSGGGGGGGGGGGEEKQGNSNPQNRTNNEVGPSGGHRSDGSVSAIATAVAEPTIAQRMNTAIAVDLGNAGAGDLQPRPDIASLTLPEQPSRAMIRTSSPATAIVSGIRPPSEEHYRAVAHAEGESTSAGGHQPTL